MNRFVFGIVCIGLTAFAVWAVLSSLGQVRSGATSADAGVAVARFCSQPDPIERRVCLIQAAVDGASKTFISARKPDMKASDVRAHFTVLELLSFVQHELSSARYSSWKRKDEFTPPDSARDAIVDAHGICGNHVQAFLLFARALGLDARSVEFWYSDDRGQRSSHIGVEIFLLNRWVFADVSWGGLFLRDAADIFSAMSLEEARANPVRPRTNANDVWFNAVTASGVDPFYYLKAPDLQITRGHVGAITLYWQPADVEGGKAWSTDLAHIPNYVGDNKPDGRQVGLEIATNLPSGEYNLKLKVAGVGGCENSQLTVGNERAAIPKTGEIALQVRDPERIKISGTDDVCYVVFSKISAHST